MLSTMSAPDCGLNPFIADRCRRAVEAAVIPDFVSDENNEEKNTTNSLTASLSVIHLPSIGGKLLVTLLGFQDGLVQCLERSREKLEG